MIMEHSYKQYVALATKWNKDVLFRARITLTLAYVGVTTFIVVVSSNLLFKALLLSVANSIEEQVPNFIDQVRLFEHAEAVLKMKLFFADIFIIAIICACAYILTEFALRPIREARVRERRFLADAAHELRTPLSVMRSGNEVVLRGEPTMPLRVKRQLTENIEEIDTLTRIANGLLALTSKKEMLENGNTFVDIGELLKMIVEKITPIATKKEVMLSLTTDVHTHEYTVRAEHTSLSRAFENIIENGIKYTKANGSVSISLQHNKGMIEVHVKDTGIGIATTDLPHVTEPFFRADLARTSNEGSGLGLSIVAETIEALQGRLIIESELDVGTTVIVSLPTHHA